MNKVAWRKVVSVRNYLLLILCVDLRENRVSSKKLAKGRNVEPNCIRLEKTCQGFPEGMLVAGEPACPP
ncbi:hypothetical protein CEE45_16410 [Candidatus Heimdallarchaeota archaeon B3_Heim]|nr:MAG: hypothetical protein CEE45_16410 [Candidatus Heimdallarchaeota archaeon B3_Heim]